MARVEDLFDLLEGSSLRLGVHELQCGNGSSTFSKGERSGNSGGKVKATHEDVNGSGSAEGTVEEVGPEGEERTKS